ncbi:MAG TPA: hypothetical protein VE735_06670, partial [Gammaproteobacteria bacterium]|nr:hypothetical protein [Gammaproteobacteria bacterium]
MGRQLFIASVKHKLIDQDYLLSPLSAHHLRLQGAAVEHGVHLPHEALQSANPGALPTPNRITAQKHVQRMRSLHVGYSPLKSSPVTGYREINKRKDDFSSSL